MQTPTERRELATAAEMVEALGGAMELNRRLGQDKESRLAHGWLARGAISAQYRPTIKDMLDEAGFSVPADFLAPQRP